MSETTGRTMNLDEAVLLAAEMMRQGDITRARPLVDQPLAAAPEHPDVLYIAAGLTWKEGNGPEAVDLQRRLIGLCPDDPAHHKNLILFLEHLGAATEVPQAYENALAHCPDDPALANGWGLRLLDAGETTTALELFDKLVAAHPDNGTGHRNRSIALLALGRPEDAVEAFSRSLTEWKGGATKPDTAVDATYAEIAAAYDSNPLQASWGRTTAELVDEILGETAGLRLLDVCCGTGSVGRHLRRRPAYLAGIDRSPEMLAEARSTGRYDDLLEADLITGMEKHEQRFRIITCSCALYHVADLDPFFRQAARLLEPSGHLVISVDPATDTFDIAVVEPGEFAHSRANLRRLAAKYGFKENYIKIDKHRAYPGFWCAFQAER